MHAAKHFDPQLGIDIHTYVYPPLPPFPLPTLHMGIVLDPFDYLPFIGSTVDVSGVKRATAGTGGLDLHIPLGLYVPPPEVPVGPQHTDEIFMGSMTVVADGDPLSRIGMPVLDCNIVGMINPFRLNKPKVPQLSMSLPTALNVAIPNSVFVGGPPMISIMGMAMKGVFAGLGRLKRLKRVESAMERMKGRWRGLFKDMPEGFFKCKVLRAEPVDMRTGGVALTHEDFVVPGRLALAWTRRYVSGAAHAGSCGVGWYTPADAHLEIDTEGAVVFRAVDGALAVFPCLPEAVHAEGIREPVNGVVIHRVVREQSDEFHVCTKDDLIHVFSASLFPKSAGARRAELERLEDRHGNCWRFERRGERLIRVVESGPDGGEDGRGRFLEVDVHDGRITRLVLHVPSSGQSHPLVRYDYDAMGDLVAAHDSIDAARTFAYREHRLVRHTDRTGLSFHYRYDSQWRVIHTWGDGGLHDYRFAYDELLHETEIVDSLGHVSHLRFDADGLPLCEIDPLGGCTSFEYDDFGRTTAVTDPAGLRTAFGYDDRGNLVRLQRADDSVTTTRYSDDNKPLAIVDLSGNTWTQTWSARGQLESQTTPLGAVTRYEYDKRGQLIRRINPRGAQTCLTFDRNGLLDTVTNALGQTTRFQLDGLGRVLRRTDPVGDGCAFDLDPKGRVRGIDSAEGSRVECEYDAEDRLIRHVDERGGVTTFEYVGTGRIGRQVQADGHSVRYLYDTEERLTGLVNQRGDTYRLDRDALGRVVAEVDFWGQVRRYEFDAGGRIARSVDSLGRNIVFTTDKMGRVIRKMLPDPQRAAKQVTETFRYDPAGQLVEFKNDVSHVTRRFNEEGHLVEERQNGFVLESRYDAAGNRIERRSSAGNRIVVAYDLLDQAIRLDINDAAPITCERDAIGRIVHERLNLQMERRFEYNERGQLARQGVIKEGQSLFHTRFEYDPVGRMTHRADSQFGSDRFTHDPMGRILSHTDPTLQVRHFLPDAAGDGFETRIEEFALEEVAGGDPSPTEWIRTGEQGGARYGFDRIGNLVSRRQYEAGAPAELRLEWDANQRLSSARWHGGPKDGQVTNYGYDALGRRVFKRSASQTTWFFWDDDALLGEVQTPNEAAASSSESVKVVDLIAARRRFEALKQSHSRAREYVYRPGTYEPLALIDPAAAVRLAATARERPQSLELAVQAADTASGASGMGMLGSGLTLGSEMPIAASPAPQDSFGQLGAGASLASSMSSTRRPALAVPGALAMSAPPSITPSPGPFGANGELPRASTGVFYYHNDPNGAPNRLLTPQGEIVWASGWSIWGFVGTPIVDLVAQPLRLQGQQADAETGLAYNRFRYFDARSGSYISKDPIGLWGGANLYSLGPNANEWADPRGLSSTPAFPATQALDASDPYILFNKTHASAAPVPRGTGPNGARLQSHHGLQQEWAVNNLSSYGYDPKLAPTITLETGKGQVHTGISMAQNARRDERLLNGTGKWSSSLQEELKHIDRDLEAAGYSAATRRAVLDQQYAMLDKLGVPYERIPCL